MPSFAVRHPYLIIVFCLFVVVLGLTSVARMPVDMFPPINIPVVLVATFYSGMPPSKSKRILRIRLSGSSRWQVAWTIWNRDRCLA